MQQLWRSKFKYWIYILVGLGITVSVAAQSTTVSGTVTDQGGQVWKNGTISYVFQNNGSFSGPYQWNGANLPNQYLTPQIVTLSGSGTFSFSIPTSTAIAPALSTWRYVVCPNASAPCAILTVPSTGSTQNISSQITAAAVTLVSTIQAGPMPLAYSDTEIITTPNQGGIYFNVVSFLPKYFDGLNWQFYGAGGGGGVTFINGVSGSFNFTGIGVSCTSTTCTFVGSASVGPLGTVQTTNGSGANTASSNNTILNLLPIQEYQTSVYPPLFNWLSAYHNCKNQIVSYTGIGDSQMIVHQGLASEGPNTYTDTYMAQMEAFLRQGCPSHGTGVKPFLAFLSGGPDLNRDFWTLTSGSYTHDATLGPNQTGFGGSMISAASGTVLTFTTTTAILNNESYDTLITYCVSGPSYGTWNISIDGVSNGSCGGNNATPIVSISTSTPVTAGAHVATFTCSATPCKFYAAQGTLGSVGVEVNNLAASSAVAEGYSNSNAFAFVNAIPGGSNLTQIAFGTNEPSQGYSTTSYATALAVIEANAIAGSSSVLIAAPPVNGSATGSQMVAYSTAALGVAQSTNSAFINYNDQWGTTFQASLFGSDLVHPNDKGSLSEYGMLNATSIDNPQTLGLFNFATLGANTFTNNQSYVLSQNALISWSITNSNSGNSAQAIYGAHSDACDMYLGATSSTFTVVPARGYINSQNCTLSIEQSGIERIGITSSLITMNLPMVSSTINATVGFELGGAAPSGHYPRGNGTNYIDGVIQSADLPVATLSTFGVVRPDGTTVTISGGILSAVSGGTGTVTSIATTGPIGGGTITTTGTITCTTCVVAGSPGVGIAHFAGGTQTVTSSLVALGSDVSGNLPNANLASQTANTVLGALTATTPSGLAVPSCSTTASALNWTSGSGFSCNATINAATLGGATFASPGTIGGTTPGVATFTTLTASTSLTLSAITGSTQCLQVNTSGVVSGFGSACGGGGGSIVFPQTISGTVTSGGIPYFSSTTVMTSSALLPTGDFILGGGVGGAPTATFSVVPIVNGGSGAATWVADSVLNNGTGSTAAPTITATPTFQSLTLTSLVATPRINGTGSNSVIQLTSSSGVLPPTGNAFVQIKAGGNIDTNNTATTSLISFQTNNTFSTLSGTLTVTAPWIGAEFAEIWGVGGSTAITYNSTTPMTQVHIIPTINVTAASTGHYDGILFKPTETSIGTGVRNFFWEQQTNSGATASSMDTTGFLQATAYGQVAASNTGGTCAMAAGTSCTITIAHTYTTPVCIATQQSATLTGGAVGCTVSGTTVTITSAVLNSETWGALVFGNPN